MKKKYTLSNLIHTYFIIILNIILFIVPSIQIINSFVFASETHSDTKSNVHSDTKSETHSDTISKEYNNTSSDVYSNTNNEVYNEPCIETETEFMQSYKMVKNHFMNSNNITNDVYNQYKQIESLLELGKKEDITEDQIGLYNSTKLKLEQTSILNTLFYCIIEKSNFIPDHINDNIPYDSEIFRNCLLQGFEHENKLLSRITKTKTQLGAIMTALNFLRSHDITQQKDKMQSLLSNIEDMKKLEVLFNTISEHEKDFIKLFSNSDTKRRYGINDYNIYIELANNIIYRKKTGKLFKVIIFIVLYVIMFYATFIHKFTIATIDVLNKNSISHEGPILFTHMDTLKKCIQNGGEVLMRTIIGLILSAHIGMVGYIIFSIKHLFNPSNFYNTLSQKFNSIKTYIESMQSIYNIIRSNTTLDYCFSKEMPTCAQLFDTDKKNTLNSDVSMMLSLLKIIPYNWSYWKEWGRARAKYFCKFFYLFEHNKDFLINVIMEIANVEIYVFITTLLQNNTTPGKEWNIVEISDSEQPFLYLNDVWTPIIDKNLAVTNDVCFDAKKRFMLIYGMNAGGKTTFIQSIITSLLLSYSYGISPSRKCILTPFKRIFIAIDISTNFEKKQSKFMSELILCDNIISNSKNIKDKNFGFIICDELFCGTNPKDSNLFATNFIKFIAQNKNIIGVYATHDEGITSLESMYPKLYFENYHMKVKDDLNELKYYYKIEKGIKKQQIALALAADMGRRKLLKNYNILLGI